MKTYGLIGGGVILLALLFLGFKLFSEESQNKAKRFFESSIGFKYGRVDIFAGQSKPVLTWLGVEKLTSATDEETVRSYRYGYGYFDKNLNNKIDPEEKKIGKRYFSVNDYTMAVFRDTGSPEF